MSKTISLARPFWVTLHRYGGLAMAVFLLIAGLTGSVIAFHRELDAWLNPDWCYAQPRGERLSPGESPVGPKRASPGFGRITCRSPPSPTGRRSSTWRSAAQD